MITVIADASYWDGAGGFAYWARCDGPEKVQAAVEWPCTGINEAETVGICSGILAAIDGLPSARGMIVAQSDSLHALGLLVAHGARSAKTSDLKVEPWNNGGRKDAVGIVFARKAMYEAHKRSFTVFVKHVRGHSGIDAPRSKVNEWCDAEAKRVRRMCASKLIDPNAQAIIPADLPPGVL